LKDIDVYCGLVEEFVNRMIRPEAGQFRLEITTFRIILERASRVNPLLQKVSITDNGGLFCELEDDPASLAAITLFLQKSTDFLSSLMGEEVARDQIEEFIQDNATYISETLSSRRRIIESLPEPFKSFIKGLARSSPNGLGHDEIIQGFTDVYNNYIKDLSRQTDLSAFRLKLGILREDHRLLRHLNMRRNNLIEIDASAWADASDQEVGESLLAAFNSLVGLSTFLMGKEEALRKGTQIFAESFEGKEGLLARYISLDEILEGSLNRKVSTGLPELDRRLCGGIPKGSAILLVSPQGMERDLLVNSMILRCLDLGGSMIYVSSRDPPKGIRSGIRSQGLDCDKLEEDSRIRIVDWFSWRGERIIGVERDGYALKSSKILSNLSIAISKATRELHFANHQIAFVNIIPSALNIFDFQQVYNFVQRLRAKFKEESMASVFFGEKESVDPEIMARIREVFDGTIEINRSQSGPDLERTINIVSLSGVDFDHRPIPVRIENSRIVETHSGRPTRSMTEKGISTQGPASEDGRTRTKPDRRMPKKLPERLAPIDEKVMVEPEPRGDVILAPPVRMHPKRKRTPSGKDKVKPRTVKTVKRRGKVGQPKVPAIEATPHKLLEEAMTTIDELLGEGAKSASVVRTIKVRRKAR